MATLSSGEAVQSAVGADGAGPGFQRAGERAGAYSVPNALPAPAQLHSADLVPVTDSDALQPAPPGWQEAACRAQRYLERISAGASLAHARPSSLAETRERHHRAAGHWNAAAMRIPRIIYGYIHLGVKGLLHLIEWVLESPPRLACALAALYFFVFWS